MAKDLFSEDSGSYAQFRPGYPAALFQHILHFVNEKETAWDCATGNGQAAIELAKHFKIVQATDLSDEQLKNATKKENIHYSTTTAEQTPFNDNTFDLITVATAYHWFNHEAFFAEANRVGKNKCVVAVWTYAGYYTADDKINAICKHFYKHIINTYWEPERHYVDEEYKTVPFNFEPLPVAPFQTIVSWKQEQLMGYLGTWSAVQKYTKVNGTSPLALIEKEIASLWPDDKTIKVTFPLSLRLGRIAK